MLRLVLAGVLAALAAGCATKPPIAREVSDAVDGARVTLAPGQDLFVNLEGNQTTGFRWSLTRAAVPVLTQVGEATYTQRATEGRLVGASGVTTFHFRGAVAGTSSLAFSYRRPWEMNIPPARTIHFEIRVE